VSSINYGALAGGESTQPPDGLHDAYLTRARLQTGQQDFVATEWQVGAYWWETLYGFTPQRLPFTQDMLDGLGIDRAKLTDDDALEAALNAAQGSQYRVRVETNGRFVNTYIEGAVAQRSFETDIPADTSGLPEVSQSPSGLFVTDGPRQTALAGAGNSPPSAADDDLDDIPF
jgi:hypothetical protein